MRTVFTQLQRDFLVEVSSSSYLPQEVIDSLVDTVQKIGSLDTAIKKFEKLGQRTLSLPGGHRPQANELVDVLKSWKPKSHSGDTVVYHATDPETAKFILTNGVVAPMKPWTLASRRFARGEFAQFSPGAGVERGIYVGLSPEVVAGFGRVILEIKVPRQWLKVPAELKTLGHKDPVSALGTEHGALIRHSIHPHNIRKIVTESTSKEKMLGYKAMRYERGEAVSGADSRHRFKVRKGKVVRMPGKGIFLSPNRQYVLDYYAGHNDTEVLLTLEFDPAHITSGANTLSDREPELTVSSAKIVDFELLHFDEGRTLFTKAQRKILRETVSNTMGYLSGTHEEVRFDTPSR